MNTSETTYFYIWSQPVLIKSEEVGDTVEFTYKETSMVSYSLDPSRLPEQRVFKIVFSCKDGRWHKSKPIYGTIIPATEEDYDFE